MDIHRKKVQFQFSPYKEVVSRAGKEARLGEEEVRV